MTGWIDIVQPGVGTTSQDRGRAGQRHHGIPVAGWLDELLATAANALVGNTDDAAVLELRGVGTELRVKRGPVRLALAGAISARWLHADGRCVPLLPWQTATLNDGDKLQLGAAESGCAYLAVAGGWLVPAQLGSRSSYWRAGLQGVLGRALRPGDQLPCGRLTLADPREWRVPQRWPLPTVPTTPAQPIRVILGPQQGHFHPDAVASFLHQTWQATQEQDRMGLRLRGTPLAHINTSAADIASDGVTAGAIQVPAAGQPIVLLADSQTVGGYPKIATVIRADLPRLAHLKPGTWLSFESVTREQAQQALRQQHAQLARWIATREAFLPAGFIDTDALYAGNLVSGVLRAEY